MNNDFNEENKFIDLDQEQSVSRKNRNEFESVMNNARVKKDDYFDSNSKVVRIALLVLGIIIVIGVAYYLILWFTNK